MRKTRWLWFICATAIASVQSSMAYGHAMLERAEPAVGSTIEEAPTMVRLHFSERLEPAFSALRVEDAAGKTVDRGDTRVDPDDSVVLEVSLPDLPHGKYRVIWRAVSVDTHVTEGDFTFTVGQ